ncbi:MAG: hypothetical protein QM775_04465 [Pirellulales bacterium]
MTSIMATTFANLPVLFAADWTTAVLWLVVISIGVINQLLGGDKKKQPQNKPQAQKPPNQGAKGILDEVEKFLQDARKATEQAQNRPPQQQRPAPPQPARTPQQQREQQQRAAAQRKQKQQREAAAKKAQQEARAKQEAEARRKGPLSERHLQSKLERSSEEETFRGTVSEHVQQHLDTSRFDERAGRLSQLQKTVEQDIAGHVHSVFDHQVGTLAKTEAGGQTAAATPAEQIATLLREPQSLAAAVILQEVLRPPVERW